jgi:hypothetical protein
MPIKRSQELCTGTGGRILKSISGICKATIIGPKVKKCKVISKIFL